MAPLNAIMCVGTAWCAKLNGFGGSSSKSFCSFMFKRIFWILESDRLSQMILFTIQQEKITKNQHGSKGRKRIDRQLRLPNEAEGGALYISPAAFFLIKTAQSHSTI